MKHESRAHFWVNYPFKPLLRPELFYIQSMVLNWKLQLTTWPAGGGREGIYWWVSKQREEELQQNTEQRQGSLA